MSGKTVYLITGANRGIGYTLAKTIAARPNTIVFAGARDPAVQSLTDLAASHPNVHPIKIVSADQASNEAAIAEIQKTAGQLDVVIANAGIAKHYGPIGETAVSEFKEHWEVNTLGVVVLFQAAQHLLFASPTGAPIFALISSTAGSISTYFSVGAAAYASSKAAANLLIKALHAENPTLVAIAIHPGFVATDMGNYAAVTFGMPEAPVSVEESVAGVLNRIDGATREKSSGRFFIFAKSDAGNPWDINTDEIAW